MKITIYWNSKWQEHLVAEKAEIVDNYLVIENRKYDLCSIKEIYFNGKKVY